MATQLMLHEIFDKLAETKARKDKIQVLHDNNSLVLRDVLRGTFDETVQWNLPEGAPPFERDDAPIGYNHSNIIKQGKKLAYFAKGGPGDRLPQYKRERMFIECLEAVHPKDADILIWMKDKQLGKHYKGLTKKLVQEAFPKLIVE